MRKKDGASEGRSGRSDQAGQPVHSCGLHIVVCVKPVPDPARWEKLRLDPETLLLNRAEVPAVINPLDLNAIERAVAIKETLGGNGGSVGGKLSRWGGEASSPMAPNVAISVLTMAPPDSEEQLREALAMGCDRAYLASDRAFAGADSLATAKCLAAAIRKIGSETGLTAAGAGCSGVDLVFCGAYSADGSTAQVGPQIAELLEIPDLTHAVKLELVGGGAGSASVLRVACKVEEGTLVAECDLPALVTFDREANQPRLPAMHGIRRARELPFVIWSAADLGLGPESVGLKGSPTQMLNVYQQAQGRKGEILTGAAGEIAATLVARLRADKILDDA
jgi:electron transfer flavoprotein beta subunit